jgi:integrase
MATMKLTAAQIQRLELPTKQNDVVYFDSETTGFGVRLRSTGGRSYVFYYKAAGRTRRCNIGTVSATVTAAEVSKAREAAKTLAAKVRLGRDPATERKEKIAQTSDTLHKLVDRYLDYKKPEVRPRSYSEIERHLKEYAKPLHSLPLHAVDQRTIADRLSSIAKNSGAVTANRVRSSLSAMFSWAMGEGIALLNQVANTNKREEQSRDRVLTPSELRLVWNAAGADHHGVIIKVLMLTGQRRNEIANLRWDEIDFDESLVSLSAARTKNAHQHTVPMSDTVHDLLKAQERKDGRPFVFGYRANPFSGWSKAKAELDEAITKANGGKAISRWTLHDLRRSTATGMADLGVQPHIVESVLNHQSGHKAGVAGTYNRSTYEPEKRTALDRWAEHLLATVAGKQTNVTSIKKRA